MITPGNSVRRSPMVTTTSGFTSALILIGSNGRLGVESFCSIASGVISKTRLSQAIVSFLSSMSWGTTDTQNASLFEASGMSFLSSILPLGATTGITRTRFPKDKASYTLPLTICKYQSLEARTRITAMTRYPRYLSLT